MATDFTTNTTSTKGGFKPSSVDTPIDVRTRIETLSDIETIPLPYVGMVFYVRETGKRYEVLSLKDKKSGMSTTKDAMVDEYREMLVSYNDLLDKPEIPNIGHLATKEDVSEGLAGKIDKEEGKSLLADSEIKRLKGLYNYDDYGLRIELEGKSDIGHVHDINSIEGIDQLPFASESDLYNYVTHEQLSNTDRDLREVAEFHANNASDLAVNMVNDLRDEISANYVDIISHNNLVDFVNNFGSVYAEHDEVNAVREYVVEQIEAIEHPQYDDSELRDMIEAIEVPSVEGLATEEFVKEQIEAIEHPQYDDSELRGIIADKADKSELFSGEYEDLANKPEIPSIEGLATEDYVVELIEAIEIPEVPSIDHLATKEELGSGLDTKVDKEEGKSLVDDAEITRLAGVFNANYQFKVKMIEFGLEPTVEVTGEYPNLVVTFGIPYCIPIEEKIWYGWIPYDETGEAGFCTPEEIHEGLDKRIIQFGINNGTLIEAKPGEVEYSVTAPDNAWICTIVPVKSGLKGYIDDGVGNKIPFTEMDTASGFACDDLEITNTIDFVKYKVSGLYVVTAGAETIIYIENN